MSQKAYIMQNAVNGGEISDHVALGRIDIQKYNSSVALMRNMFARSQGGASRRSGTRFICEAKHSDSTACLIPFQFNTEQAYVLEFGDKSMRVLKDGGIVVIPGPELLINGGFATDVSSWIALNSAVLTSVAGGSEENCLELKEGGADEPGYSQVAAIEAGSSYSVEWNIKKGTIDEFKLVLWDVTNDKAIFSSVWTKEESEEFVAYEQTFLAPTGCTSVDIRIFSRAVSGSGDTILFDSFSLVQTDIIYEIETPYTEEQVHELRFTQSADILYLAHKDHPPRKLIRTDHAEWTFETIVFTAKPADWSDENGYPTITTFYEQRLGFAAAPSRRQTIWLSKIDDYEDFGKSSPLVDGDACTYTLSADQVNAILWMKSGRRLLIGTSGGEWWLDGKTDSEPITPTSVKTRRETAWGSHTVDALCIGDMVLFVQRDGYTIREQGYTLDKDGYSAKDINVLARHLFEGKKVKSWTYQQSPDSLVWVCMDDGSLVGITYFKEHDVIAYHRHDLGGNGFVESVASIPGDSFDEVWLLVRREINGEIVRYIERFDPPFSGTTAKDAFFVDSGLSYEGAPVSVLYNLDHLEGATVQILADGTVHPEKVVVNGGITLDYPSSAIHVGLGFQSDLMTLPVEVPTQTGTAQGRTKKILSTTLRLYQSLGVKAGDTADRLETQRFTKTVSPLDETPALVTGDFKLEGIGTYGTNGQIYLRQDSPLPLTVEAYIHHVEVS